MTFLAIDFETANYKRNSACALGLARVVDGAIVDQRTYLIKPPTMDFYFTYLHGISWSMVANEPTFGELWEAIEPMFRGVDFVVAHNAAFDKGVLRACCEHYDIEFPQIRFECTVKKSRELWGIYPTKLNNVCEYFNIPLNHHEAGSDTEACARIMIEAVKEMNRKEKKSPF